MAIDYYVQYPCKVRETVSDDALLRMEKALGYAETMLQALRKDLCADRSQPESEWTFTIQLKSPENPAVTHARIGDLLAQAEPLKALSAHCRNCPARLREANDFSCGGYINYPISVEAEAWLVARLPDDLASPAGQFLLNAIRDMEYDGKAVDAERTRDTGTLQSSRPAVRQWRNLPSRKALVSSSQIIQMTFRLGNLGSAHAKMLAWFLGYLELDPRSQDWHYSRNPANHPQDDDDTCIAQIKQFLWAAAFAGMNGIDMFLDV